MERLRGLFGRRSGEPTSTWAQPAPFSLGICLMEGGTISPGLSSVSGLSVCPSSLTWFLCDHRPRFPAKRTHMSSLTPPPSPSPTGFSGDIKVVCSS